METAVAANARDRETVSRQPRFSGLSHVSLACRDLAESKLFYSEVLGGELVFCCEKKERFGCWRSMGLYRSAGETMMTLISSSRFDFSAESLSLAPMVFSESMVASETRSFLNWS